ncbi:MAG: hypothetical protein ACLSB9_25235 [Hydrogeniiclostridium mannosilyticum]
MTWDPYNKEPVTACIEIEDINISNTLKSTSKMLVGYKPPQTEDQTYYDYEDILTGSGDYVIPDEVYSLTVVCIQAGTGGQAGFDGESGGSSQLIVTSRSKTPEALGRIRQKMAGKAERRALQALAERPTGRRLMLFLVRSSTMSAAPQALEERRMGPWALLVAKRLSGFVICTGSVSDTGYTDPVSGDVLAKPGTEGVDGAAGGRGGKASVAGGLWRKRRGCAPNTGGPGGPPYKWKFDDYTSENIRIYGGGAGGGAAHGKTETPAATVQRQSVEQERLLMHLKRRTK